jgi:hypothetical protein
MQTGAFQARDAALSAPSRRYVVYDWLPPGVSHESLPLGLHGGSCGMVCSCGPAWIDLGLCGVSYGVSWTRAAL